MQKPNWRKFTVTGTISDETKILGTTYGEFKKMLERHFGTMFPNQYPNGESKEIAQKTDDQLSGNRDSSRRIDGEGETQ
jgi:hypothetical protein